MWNTIQIHMYNWDLPILPPLVFIKISIYIYFERENILNIINMVDLNSKANKT